VRARYEISVKANVTLRRTVSESVGLGVEHTLGLVNRQYFLSEGFCLKAAVLSVRGALSHEKKGLQFAMQSLKVPSHAEPVICRGPGPAFIFPRVRVA
jgi:hypothetical protein